MRSSAAVAIVRALAGHAWPDGVDVRVRIGIHSGEAASTGDTLHRLLGVHRAARVGSIAHGGQVLLSDSTRSLVEDDLPDGVQLRDLGLMRLKDIDRPERISQVTADGLKAEFPPLKAEKVRERPRVRQRTIRLVALAAVIAAAVAIAICRVRRRLWCHRSASRAWMRTRSGWSTPLRARSRARSRSARRPRDVAVGEGAIWVSNADSNSVSRIDPRKPAVVQTIPVGSSPSGIVTGNGAVWVANSLDSTVSRIDPATNTVVQPIPCRQRARRHRVRSGVDLGSQHGRRNDHENRRRQRQARQAAADRCNRARLRRRHAVGERQHRKPGRSDRSGHGQRRRGSSRSDTTPRGSPSAAAPPGL